MRSIRDMGVPYRIGVIRLRGNEPATSDIENFLRDESFLKPDEVFSVDDIRPSGRGLDASLIPQYTVDYGLYLNAKPSFFHQAYAYHPCWRGELAISPTGVVYPCVFSRNLEAGNLTKESLDTVVERLRQTYWSITLDQIAKCRDCELRYACMDCRVTSDNTSDLYGAPLRCSYDPYGP